MFWKKQEFKLHQYPYFYECSECKRNFKPKPPPIELTQDDERELKEDFGIKSDLPLFLECYLCHQVILKPRGYTGKPSFIVPAGEPDFPIIFF